MIDRTDLRKIARERLKDAEALLAAARYDGAIYLGGYVVELSLKAAFVRISSGKVFHKQKESFKAIKVLRLMTLMFCYLCPARNNKSRRSIWLNGLLWLLGILKRGILRSAVPAKAMLNCWWRLQRCC